MWIIQRKLFKGDWETIAFRNERTKKEALKSYEHMNGKLRAVSEIQALRDYEAGRADNFQYPTSGEYAEEARQVAAMEQLWIKHMLCIKCDQPERKHPHNGCAGFDTGEPIEHD